MKNKICVYTCITGDYDEIKEIKNKELGIDYYLFTNNKNIKSNTWNIKYIADKELSNVLLARKTKILGNEIVNNYDIAVWIDAAVEFKKNIKDFIKKYFKSTDTFACFKHGIRYSIKEEMDACLRFRKEEIKKIDILKKFYEKNNYKYDNGLIESTVYIKRPYDTKVKETMEIWFDMVKNYTKRDQLSFNYAIFKSKLNVKWINEKVFDNKWFKWHEHNYAKLPQNYMIYYGNIDEYDYSKQYTDNYNIKNNTYIINTKILNDCSEIYLEISNSLIIKYKIEEINLDCKVDKQNTIKYFNDYYFFKNPGFVILKGKFKKGMKLNIVIYFELVEEYEKNELIDYIVLDREKCKSKNYEIQEAYNLVINSTSWKITKPLRFIKRLFKINKK